VGFSAGAATAAQVRDCDTYEANVRNLNVPYSEAVREYAKGQIVLMSMFIEEPACCGSHLVVLFPSADDYYQECRLVSWTNDLGYLNINLNDAAATYDPAKGLTVSVPSQLYDVDSDFRNGVLLDITVNQAKGEVSVRETLGVE
jgi:hypothetical protein